MPVASETTPRGPTWGRGIKGGDPPWRGGNRLCRESPAAARSKWYGRRFRAGGSRAGMRGHAPMHGDCGRAPSAPQPAPEGAGSDFVGETGGGLVGAGGTGPDYGLRPTGRGLSAGVAGAMREPPAGREGWKPDRGETGWGMARLDVQHESPARSRQAQGHAQGCVCVQIFVAPPIGPCFPS